LDFAAIAALKTFDLIPPALIIVLMIYGSGKIQRR
jgi:hypothetical protein